MTPAAARVTVRTNTTVIAALMVRRGEADAMLCGLEGRFPSKLRYIRDVIGLSPGVTDLAALSLLITNRGAVFIADTHVRSNPSPEEIADMTFACAGQVRRFGLEPKIALVSDSDFGGADTASALTMRRALDLILARGADFEIDGEMQADSALSPSIRARVLPNSRLRGEANVLIMPSLESANIAFQIVKVTTDALSVGPLLMGPAKPAHVLTPSVTARGVVNMTAIAATEAQALVADGAASAPV
jgi:malate dehydrogenase (oxaloacetate-decarboxylating)(NADP+)